MVDLYCKSCPVCQQMKGENKAAQGLLHALPVPTRPWQSIGMDFVGPFPEVDGYNYLWVVICRLTTYVHLIPTHTSVTASQLAWSYLKEIVQLHGLPESFVSDRDAKFTSKFWKELHWMLGSTLLMSTAFHPQTDGVTEHANRTIIQIIRVSIRPDQKDWVQALPMTEFAINMSVSATTGLAPFKFQGYMPSMMKTVSLTLESTPPGVRAFALMAVSHVAQAHDAIIASRVFQTHQANKHRRQEPMFTEGDLVYLSTKNLSLPKGRASKLCPKYVGPYKILKTFHDSSTYELELPPELMKRGIHPKFHVSLLRPHVANDVELFPNR